MCPGIAAAAAHIAAIWFPIYSLEISVCYSLEVYVCYSLEISVCYSLETMFIIYLVNMEYVTFYLIVFVCVFR